MSEEYNTYEEMVEEEMPNYEEKTLNKEVENVIKGKPEFDETTTELD